VPGGRTAIRLFRRRLGDEQRGFGDDLRGGRCVPRTVDGRTNGVRGDVGVSDVVADLHELRVLRDVQELPHFDVELLPGRFGCEGFRDHVDIFEQGNRFPLLLGRAPAFSGLREMA
jgi:hypothetical protein